MTDPIAAIEALELSVTEVLGEMWSPYAHLPPTDDFEPAETLVWPLVQMLLADPRADQVAKQLKNFRVDLLEQPLDEAEDKRVAEELLKRLEDIDNAELDDLAFP